MAKIILTGATGYIGQFLALYMRNRGHEVWAALHDKSRRFLLPEWINVTDLCEAKGYPEWDAIVHLAYGAGDGWRQTLQLNINMAKRVIEIAEYSKAKIIFASSIAVLGYCPKNIAETSRELRKVCKDDVYTYVKGYLEKYMKECAQKKKLKIRVVRIGNVMGPGSMWAWLLLNRLQSHRLCIDFRAFSNSTSIFNLTSLIVDDLLSEENGSEIVLSTEFSHVTWGEWIQLITKGKTIFDRRDFSFDASERETSTSRVQIIRLIRRLKGKKFIRKITTLLPEQWYDALRVSLGGPLFEVLDPLEHVSEAEREVFHCFYAWPSAGCKKYTLEETAEKIRIWAQEAGFII